MRNEEWKTFFEVCARLLGEGKWNIRFSKSWCSWTTFDRLEGDAGYWTAGLPGFTEIGNEALSDGGTWGQPFRYVDIAHVIVPKTFTTDLGDVRKQDINLLQRELETFGIESRLTERVLEIKLY